MLAAGGLAFAATTWDYSNLYIPGLGGYNCTVARTAEQAPYFTVHVTNVGNDSELNYFSGKGCIQGSNGGTGGTSMSSPQAIVDGETLTWNVGDTNGDSIQRLDWHQHRRGIDHGVGYLDALASAAPLNEPSVL